MRRYLPFVIACILGLSACKTERDVTEHDVLGVVSQISDDGQMPWLVEIQAEYAEQGFEIIGIATDPHSRDAISELVAELNVDYTILLSDGDIEAEVGGVYAIPTTFILDRDGGVRHMHVGLVQKEVLQDEIRALF